MARARGSLCPPLPPGRMSWPHGALLFLWLFSPPLGAGGGGMAVTSAAGGGAPPATSCPAACSCSNQASRVICTRRELAEVPASIPVNTRYLNLQENGIQVSQAAAIVGTLGQGRAWWPGGWSLLPEPPALRAHPSVPWALLGRHVHPRPLSRGCVLGFLSMRLLHVSGLRQNRLPASHSTGATGRAGGDPLLRPPMPSALLCPPPGALVT